ncbi:hypothetical protein GCM10009557_71300 [Virgisporangium ochraceum]
MSAVGASREVTVAGSRISAGVAVVSLTIAVVVLVAGAGYALLASLRGERDGTGRADAVPSSAAATSDGAVAPTAGAEAAGSREDALAAAPMTPLPPSAVFPRPLATTEVGPPIEVPWPGAGTAPDGHPFVTGFPRTPEGALGQLVAIDEAALNRIDLDRVYEVYAWAARPGAVAKAEWEPAKGVAGLIRRLGGADRVGSARMAFQVVQGQVKGSVGPDFVVACVLGVATVSTERVGQGGVGDCQRMVWSEGRWWIGPGAQPAPAPSAWPGSADAARAGWRVITRAR